MGVAQDGSSSRDVLHAISPSDEPQRDQERVLLLVALHDHQVLVEDRRAGRAPLVARVVVGADVEAPEVALPLEVAREVVGVEPLRPEEGDHVAPVGRRRRVRVGGLDVPLLLRHSRVGGALPLDLAAALVEAQHLPLVLRDVLGSGARAVEPRLERGIRPRRDRRRDEHLVAPHHGARVREAGDARLPEDAGRAVAVPRVRQVRAVRDARRVPPAELRPAARRPARPRPPSATSAPKPGKHDETQDARDAACRSPP